MGSKTRVQLITGRPWTWFLSIAFMSLIGWSGRLSPFLWIGAEAADTAPPAGQGFIEVDSLAALREKALELRASGHQVLVFLDLDDTTFAPTTFFGGDHWFDFILSKLSREMDSRESALTEAVRRWNAAQLILWMRPLDPKAVSELSQMRAAGVRVHSLTARGLDIRERTLEFLKAMDVTFDPLDPDGLRGGSFLRDYGVDSGIIFAPSPNSKGAVLRHYLLNQKFDGPICVIFADDKLHHLESVERELAQMKAVTPFVFHMVRARSEFHGPAEEIARIQEDALQRTGVLLPNSAARVRMGSGEGSGSQKDAIVDVHDWRAGLSEFDQRRDAVSRSIVIDLDSLSASGLDRRDVHDLLVWVLKAEATRDQVIFLSNLGSASLRQSVDRFLSQGFGPMLGIFDSSEIDGMRSEGAVQLVGRFLGVSDRAAPDALEPFLKHSKLSFLSHRITRLRWLAEKFPGASFLHAFDDQGRKVCADALKHGGSKGPVSPELTEGF